MKVINTVNALALGTMLAVATIAAPVLAADGDAMIPRAEWMKMAKDGMISKKDYMSMMEKKFDEMDKSKKGMVSVDEVMRIFGRSDKG